MELEGLERSCCWKILSTVQHSESSDTDIMLLTDKLFSDITLSLSLLCVSSSTSEGASSIDAQALYSTILVGSQVSM